MGTNCVPPINYEGTWQFLDLERSKFIIWFSAEMVRRHGWQLPAHTFQVVAITVFFLLVVAFYAFFAPFLGGRILEYVSIGVYTPVVLAVFILYVRCTAINPADPGIMSKFNGGIGSNPMNNLEMQNTNLPGNLGEVGGGIRSPSSVSRSSTAANSNKKASAGEDGERNFPLHPTSKQSSCCLNFGGICCALFAAEDCCRHDGVSEQHGEDALFCTLCNAEVRKFSKHCRSCDKCVDGFDHHCRWLNNCVGRKNYITFISLMATSLVWLVIECGVGIAVLVRCFVDRKDTERQIIDRLGDGFSRAPFATVVAICSAVSLLACAPLGELFFFHMILIRKGITTYEYVVAMRAMSEAPGPSVDEDNQNVLYSPTGSATTGLSGGSSLGLQYKGAWCTPPRVFIDHQDEVIPHLDPGMVPSTVDPDAAGFADRGNKMLKRPVRISAWKLAMLDSNEAMRAAAKARASSSVLRPLDSRRGPDADLSSCDNMSGRSSMSTDYGLNKEAKIDPKLSPLGNSSYPPSHASRDEYETGTHSISSFSSPSHVQDSVSLSSLPLEHASVPSAVSQLPHFVPDRPFPSRGPQPAANINNQPLFQPSNTSFDDRILQKSTTDGLLFSGQPALRENKRTSVVWDQEAGRYVSIPVSTRAAATLDIPVRTSQAVLNPPVEISGHGRRLNVPEASTARAPPIQQSERLTYTGQSIFFGGPLLSVPPVRDNQRNETINESLRPGRESVPTLPPQNRMTRGPGTNQFPVFTPGASAKYPPSGQKRLQTSPLDASTHHHSQYKFPQRALPSIALTLSKPSSFRPLKFSHCSINIRHDENADHISPCCPASSVGECESQECYCIQEHCAAEITFPEDTVSGVTSRLMPSSVAELNSSEEISPEFVCLSCLQVSREVEKVLTDPTLLEKAGTVSADICNLMPSSYQVKCMEMSEMYVRQAILFLQGYFSEENLCNSTGLCPEAASSLLHLSTVEEIKVPDERSCSTCRNAVAQLQQDLDDPELKIKVIRALLKACENTGDHAKECKKIVFKYGPLILANLDKYLTDTDLCYTLHLCDSTAPHLTKALAIEMPGARYFSSFSGKMAK
ncbi:hypothetical protein H6P81_019123 [Aristolochia fimbriata]|uniref:Saposin B-type domain-containing protein n=1 Tax=Aristolochia fimbriata TaxID=158543 RepID=A0AAV7DRS0_ARIFI|nr:hypothetical protein H6P81_019123 [Aristolochia fimbriata]